MRNLSIVIPTYNESGNLKDLLHRIDLAMGRGNILYETIFIDDHSTDKTLTILKQFQTIFPIRVFTKKGARGKAQSLLEGFEKASFETICMIDADLQYPPEDITKMLEKLDEFDIVVANRVEQQTSLVRRVTSRGFSFIFANLLHGIDVDVQSGLKVFEKAVLKKVKLAPKPWTFDLEFLVKAREAGFSIGSTQTTYSHRTFGKSNLKLLPSIWEIGSQAIALKFRQRSIVPLKNQQVTGTNGFYYKGKPFVTFSNLELNKSAFFNLSRNQKFYFLLFITLLFLSLLTNWHTTLVISIAFLTFLYFADMFFNLILIVKSLKEKMFEEKITLKDSRFREWPKYTILCPLYREHDILPQFVNSINKLDYPKEKLEVLLLLEKDDEETLETAKSINLPYYFKILLVPNSFPKTKPKACNFGLKFSTGEYCVIYDAEDIPDTDQLKKAVETFEASEPTVVCLQAKLNFYNPNQNTLTKLFASEYSLWFEMILVGLHRFDAPIPLGGTSNHFKTRILRKLRGWDSFNVTEDCDLGIRLSKKGFQTKMLDSMTLEEANSNFKNWFRQRSRWIKGYLQTYLVNLRDLKSFSNSRHWLDSVVFQLVVGGKVLSLFINPFMWIVFISYFSFRAVLGDFVDSFYPGPILYMAVVALVLGNFLYLYYYMVGCMRKGYYHLVPFAFFIPVYWLMMSVAAWIALFELLQRPHYWAKTTHGLSESTELNNTTIPNTTRAAYKPV